MWAFKLVMSAVMAALMIYSLIKLGSVAWFLIAIFPVIILVAHGVGLMINGDQFKTR